ncbi:MAG TPA: hypothetical protein VD794_04690 [Flavisolibacter sp.]|nr:hypothetical protein [Flavisolibacter sp.]
MEWVVLFSNGNPTVYEVQKGKGGFLFTPMRSLENDHNLTSFFLKKIDGGWETEENIDVAIMEQAINKIEKLVKTFLID